MVQAEIRSTVSNVAEAISNFLDIDVLIVDNAYNIVGNTYKYVAPHHISINKNSMIGEIINTGKVLAVQDTMTYAHCIACKNKDKCLISGLIGVPIFYEDAVVGAIALIVAKNRHNKVFDSIIEAVDFLERMSDLLTSKMASIDSYKRLTVVKREREIMMDSMDEALLFLDPDGKIIYYNSVFAEYFKINANILDMPIDEILDHKLIGEIIIQRRNMKGTPFYYDRNSIFFSGYLKCNIVVINGEYKGTFLIFRNSKELKNEPRDYRANITFLDILGQHPSVLETKRKAKEFAVLDEPIIITGPVGSGKGFLAKAIHNFSNRSSHAFISIDCAESTEDLEIDLFGFDAQRQGYFGIGKVNMADKGTLFIMHVEKLPLFLQEKILGVLKTKELPMPGGRSVPIDVRMLFDSTLPAQKLWDNLLEELCFRIAKSHIAIPPLSERAEDVKQIVDYYIDRFRGKYSKRYTLIEPEAISALYNYPWPENMREVEKVVERMIYRAGANISISDLNLSGISARLEDATIDDVEKTMIENMLAHSIRKDEIAERLGISRATLYRKLKKYGMNP